MGYCFRAISLFLSLSATLRENSWTDLHEIFREGVEWPWDDLITMVNSGQRSICLLSPIIAQTTGVNKSVSFARWQKLRMHVARFLFERLQENFKMDMHVNFVLSQCNQRLYTYLNYCTLNAFYRTARSSFSSRDCITIAICTACLVVILDN